MKRTLAGIDVKILPPELRTGSEPWQQAKVIEANGRDTGLSALNDGGDSFERFLKALEVGDKVLFFYHTNTGESEDIGMLANYGRWIDELEGVRYPFVQVTEWVHDLPLYYYDKRMHQLHEKPMRQDENAARLIETAVRMGLNVVAATYYHFTPNGIRFWTAETSPATAFARHRTNINEQAPPKMLSHAAIALYMGVDNQRLEDCVDEGRYFNSVFIQELLKNKGILANLDLLFPDLGIHLAKYQPATTLWGCGLQSAAALQQWFEKTGAARYVRKPLSGSLGRGVRFFNGKEFREGIKSHLEDADKAEAAYLNVLIDALPSENTIDERSVVIQEFVPSVVIPHQGKRYDGCARAVMVNGNYLKACWRLSLDHLDADSPAERRYRANTSLGSETTAMTPEEEDITAKLAEAFTSDFFAAAEAVRQRIEHERFALFENDRFYRVEDKIRTLTYVQCLKRSAEGTIDLRKSIQTHLPGDVAEKVIEVYDRL